MINWLRSWRCLLPLAIFITVTLYLSTVFTKHPCGQYGYMLEVGAILTGYHDRLFAELRPEWKRCLWFAGNAQKVPHNRLSYLKAARTLMWSVQSRYAVFWQDAESFWAEHEIANYLHVSKVQFVSTGTAALVVCMQTLGIGPGDEVIVPTFTWIATAAAVTSVGAIPIMADIDETLGMEPNSLREKITNRTKAVIAVHMRGVPCDVVAIQKVANEKNIFLIEDNAQAFGSSISGKMVGSFGIMGITSVNPSKTFHAGGQGGLVWLSPKDEYLEERMSWAVENGLSAWGGLSNLPSFKRSFKGQQLAPASQTPFAGHCFRSPSEWHAAFLRHELKQLDPTTHYMQRLKKAFVNRLDLEHRRVLQRVRDPDGDRSFTITLILWSQEHAAGLKAFLASQGVDSDISWWSKHYLPNVNTIMQKVSYHSSGFPWVTEEDQKPLKLSDYDTSNNIMNRTLTFDVSYYFYPGMLEHAADLVNSWLRFMGEGDYCNLTKRAVA